MAEYNIKSIYQGGMSTFDTPTNYGNTGKFGMGTDPRTANILKEASGKLASGVKHLELVMVTPKMIDSIPKQQIKEVKRLGKLTGAEFSVHGPVIDTTGINQQGFSELNREASERRVVDTLKRSHELNPEGNVPVVFHSAEGIPGSEWKTLGEDRKAKRLIATNRESGKLIPLEEETLYYPETKDLEKGRIHTPESRIDTVNKTEWDNSISQLIFNKERADEILQNNQVQIQHILPDIQAGNITNETLAKFPEQKAALNHFQNANAYLEDVNLNIRGLFSKAYKYGDDKQKAALKELSNNYKDALEKSADPFNVSKAMQDLLLNLKRQELAPDMYVPIEDFAVKQSSKTFGNAALASYKKFGDNAPLINIENPPGGFALSTATDLKNLVKASREEFVKQAVKEGELSKGEAQMQAEKLIGATWDVGHINMLRGQGFKEKDIIKETERIAPFVKHVHLSDNFGLEHTELPMGMGNVPIKEMMKKLGKKGFEAKKIIEAADWWQHFQTPPLQETLEEFGSPIYTGEVGTGPTPYWSQTLGLQQGYLEGYGKMLPPINFQTFGAGFSTLPMTLGGSMQNNNGSRMSGTPME